MPRRPELALNAIAPYFTMFPLEFPMAILEPHAKPGDAVLDPFCGRGTTSFAARVLGLESSGIDANPVAAAITASKLVSAEPEAIVEEALRVLRTAIPEEQPSGAFWEAAYHPEVLESLCRLRTGLLTAHEGATRTALRGIVLGALHGPLNKRLASYFSNQAPRTYAPKPGYAVRFWERRGLTPPRVDVMSVIRRRAERYYGRTPPPGGQVVLGDSRQPATLEQARRQIASPNRGFAWIVTSPPYYGMRTYGPDQWLRSWFLGGPATVQYREEERLSHRSPTAFARDLGAVWRNVAGVAAEGARMVIRFGAISDRTVSPTALIEESLLTTGWTIESAVDAGSAHQGRRQADAFLLRRSRAIAEVDVWCRLQA